MERSDDFNDFIEIVKQMRHNQRRYLHFGKPEILLKLQDLEKEVDKRISVLTDKQLKIKL